MFQTYLLSFLVLLQIFSRTPISWAGGWKILTVESIGASANTNSTSLALDSSGRPHISYYDDNTRDLKYARYDGSSWNIQIVDSPGAVGRYSSIALDSSGNPHISYRDDSNFDLKYARYTGNSWIIQTIDSEGNVGEKTSIAIDGSNNIHISYAVCCAGVKYAKYNGISWSTQTVYNNGAFTRTSIALDSSGNPRIAFDVGSNVLGLYYAKQSGSSWNVEVVDAIPNGIQDCSIAIDSSNNPHISYFDSNLHDLKYAKFNGTSWDIQVVQSAGSVGWQSSIALDKFGRPHIVYNDHGKSDLRYAKFNGASWEIQSVEGSGGNSLANLKIDSSDIPHIAYQDIRTGGLIKYAKFDPNLSSNISELENQVVIQGGEKGYVNPAKGESARITFTPSASGKVDIKIFTLSGQLVYETDTQVTSGTQNVLNWACKNLDGEIVASGTYLVYIKGSGIDTRKKIVIVK